MLKQVEQYGTVIIGGGQAGLSVGYHLKKQGQSFVVLDASERIGDSWRKRWDSLRLYSPAFRDGLPGMPFPAARRETPANRAGASPTVSATSRRSARSHRGPGTTVRASSGGSRRRAPPDQRADGASRSASATDPSAYATIASSI